jgi:hypothetical protein
MNVLGMGGPEFGEVIRGGNRDRISLPQGRRGPPYMFLRNEPTDFVLENNSYRAERQ